MVVEIIISIIIASFIAYIEEKLPALSVYKRVDPFGEEHWFLFGVRIVDLVSPKSWRSYIVGTTIGLLMPPPHILEQIFVRQLLCPDCTKKGKCISCNCNINKMNDPAASCALRRWGKMDKTMEAWEERKEKYKIKIEIKIG